MTTTIALFRGINVGGRNRLPKADLVAALEGLGLRDVRTYIQSGNAVFEMDSGDAEGLAETISASVEESHGFRPQVLILGVPDLMSAMAANPFPETVDEPKTLHLTFLADTPQTPDLEALERVKRDSERFALVGKVFYLHAPEGIGRSKLAARVVKALGVAATGRNWRTVSKIAEMVTL